MQKLELPFDEAIKKAAYQNFQTDVNQKLIPSRKWFKQEIRDMYLKEATFLLQETGENYLPVYGESHIVVKK